MGCESSRKLGCEEVSLMYVEAALNFKHIRLNSFIRSLKRFASHEQVSSSDLTLLSNKYDFKISNFSVHQNIECFYHSLKSPQDQYNEKEIAFLAILLSDKKVETKIKIVFNYFTNEKTNEIPISLLKEHIFKPMFILSSFNLVKLVNSKHVDGQVQSMINKYSQGLMDVIDKGINKLCEDYFACDSLNFSDFSKFFMLRPDLLMATGIRYYLSILENEED